MRIINNVSNVSTEVGGVPTNFPSNNVQTLINDPVTPTCCNTTICIFYDFCNDCYFNPCDFVIDDLPCFPEEIGCHKRKPCRRHCNCRNFNHRCFNCRNCNFDCRDFNFGCKKCQDFHCNKCGRKFFKF